MRQIKLPGTSSSEFGVELDKTLADGSLAVGIVHITDQPSPFDASRTLLRVNAWQVKPNGAPVQRTDVGGVQTKVAIREMIVSVAKDEYTHVVADKQIVIAASALALEAIEYPTPADTALEQVPSPVAPTPAP